MYASFDVRRLITGVHAPKTMKIIAHRINEKYEESIGKLRKKNVNLGSPAVLTPRKSFGEKTSRQNPRYRESWKRDEAMRPSIYR